MQRTCVVPQVEQALLVDAGVADHPGRRSGRPRHRGRSLPGLDPDQLPGRRQHGAGELHARDGSAVEPGVLDLRVGEDRAGQVRTAQIGATEVGAAEVDTEHDRVVQVGATQAGVGEVGEAQVRPAEAAGPDQSTPGAAVRTSGPGWSSTEQEPTVRAADCVRYPSGARRARRTATTRATTRTAATTESSRRRGATVPVGAAPPTAPRRRPAPVIGVPAAGRARSWCTSGQVRVREERERRAEQEHHHEPEEQDGHDQYGAPPVAQAAPRPQGSDDRERVTEWQDGEHVATREGVLVVQREQRPEVEDEHRDRVDARDGDGPRGRPR